MIPASITSYLEEKDIPYKRYPHRRAITAQELAQSLHVTGYRVAKSVIVNADGQYWIAVLGAPDLIDLEKLAAILGAEDVELVDENEFVDFFPDCEPGAEPPFGRLYEMQVVCDESLRNADRLLFRAGSHEEALEMSFQDFLELEEPLTGSFIEERERVWAATAGAEMHP
ncbi:MAG TPA: YbaK/EbsC family protein [Myxococcaceae bacterium]|nr:YbaK/EbsC family protein [Myxococcaceae bacterium]